MAQQDPNSDNQDVTNVDLSEGSIENIVDNVLEDEKRRGITQSDDQEQQTDTRQQQTQKRGSVPQSPRPQQTQQTQQQQIQRTPLKNIPGLFVDSDGNVTDVMGKGVARAGFERRTLEAAAPIVSKITAELTDYKGKYELLEKAHGITRDNGLTPADVLLGHQLAAAWKKDPAKTVQFLLTQAKEQGINLESVVGQTNAVDVPAIAAAITKIIDDRLGKFNPILEDFDKRAQEVALARKVDSDVEQFLSDYPDAKLHEADIADIMEKSGSQLTMHQAYVLLLRFANEKGLDFSKPLRPQLQGSSTGSAPRRLPTNNRGGLPPMGNTGSGGSRVPAKSGSASASYDDLIRETFQEVLGAQ